MVLAFVLVIGIVAVVLAATGKPPKNCTWVQTGLGKGAYTSECVHNHAHVH